MPRRKKAERLYQGDRDVEAQVRARFTNPFVMADLTAENFYHELPTRAERQAFAQEFRKEFLEGFGFIADPNLDVYPANVHYQEPFRRPLEFFEGINIAGFEPPDVSVLPAGWLSGAPANFRRYSERHRVIAHARGTWWRAQKLPMTPAERTWLAEWAPPAQPEREEPPAEPGRKVLPFKGEREPPDVLPEED